MHAGPPGRIAPTSLASIMVIGPHHATATYFGGAPKRASGSTWFGRAFTVGNWSKFLCLGGYLAPPRRVGSPRDAPPPASIPAAGAPPAGPWQELIWQFALQRLVASGM
jgi:hypothetical protein